MKQIMCTFCGDLYTDFDVAHVCKGPYAKNNPPHMTNTSNPVDFPMFDHKKAVIGAAIKGLIEGGMKPEEVKLYANLLETLYNAGYNEAVRNS